MSRQEPDEVVARTQALIRYRSEAAGVRTQLGLSLRPKIVTEEGPTTWADRLPWCPPDPTESAAPETAFQPPRPPSNDGLPTRFGRPASSFTVTATSAS